MATRSLSQQEKKFADVVDRVIADPKFAKTMQDDPTGALTSAGFRLTAAQKSALRNPRLVTGDEASARSWTRPVVRILTKGTRPVVSVAVNTVLAAQAAPSARPTKKAAAKKRTAAKRKR
jgi:hypothetical protein